MIYQTTYKTILSFSQQQQQKMPQKDIEFESCFHSMRMIIIIIVICIWIEKYINYNNMRGK